MHRRDFLSSSIAGAGFAAIPAEVHNSQPVLASQGASSDTASMIGAYGQWAAGFVGDEPANLSFRRPEYDDVDEWRKVARQRALDRLLQPDVAPIGDVVVEGRTRFEGVEIERLRWQLSFGPPTRAVFLKPSGAKGRLPGVVGLHDHGGNKFFGHRKITRDGVDQHPVMRRHQAASYGGVAWANELAKRGYAVLVHDTFTFGSRKVAMQDVLPQGRSGIDPVDSEDENDIAAYNRFASRHEHYMAKSLFCAGTTWPGVFAMDDRRALDYLANRPDVDPDRLGCAGLSGGGLRTVFLGGLDPRVRCACCVGMMTTWRDYLLHKCYTHTWMIYVPGLPRELDYPELLGIRVPLPTFVLNNTEDPLFTLPEMRRADDILRTVYTKAQADDAYRCSFYPGPHKFDLPMQRDAFAWFDQWLKA